MRSGSARAARAAAGALAALAAVLGLAGCAAPAAPAVATPPPPSAGAEPVEPATSPEAKASDAWPGAGGQVLARSDALQVYLPVPGDRLGAIAERLLGDPAAAWWLAEANGLPDLHAADVPPPPGQPLLVPASPRNPTGVTAQRLQVVTVLCYHRFGGPPSRMNVTAAAFDAQLAWLVRNDYRVVRLADLQAHLEGRRALPPRAVVLTIDDGYESAYRVALPLLRRHGVPATLFVTSDFLGARDGLNARQLQALRASGLVDIQAHGRTHRSLTDRGAGDSGARVPDWLDNELRQPRELLARRLPGHEVLHLAYPYGDADGLVVQATQQAGYALGLTVQAGGNPFFAHPLLLRRTMIYGDQDLAAFQARLQVERPWRAP